MVLVASTPRSGRLALRFALALAAAASSVPACTTGIFAGAATADGRPILWKNRDADGLQNQVVYRDDGRYAYLGLVDRGDTLGLEVWAGVNSAGFAIMNSASYNLGDEETTAEGQLMRLALQSCRTVEEFERLLARSATGKRDIGANFGVIDAAGGAATFEVGADRWQRYDAGEGCVLRSNFSLSGDEGQRTGITRDARAHELLDPLVAGRRLDARSLFALAARDVANASLGADPRRGLPVGARFAWIGDSLNRESTASVTVIVGVRPGEDPALATAWFLLGQPITGVAVPAWVAAGVPPAELAAGREPAPLNAAFDRVRALLYPDRRGDRKRYLDGDAWRRLGLEDALVAVEAEGFARVESALSRWRERKPTPDEQRDLQTELAAHALAQVERLLARWSGDAARPR